MRNKIPAGEGYINVTGGNVWYRVTGEGGYAPRINIFRVIYSNAGGIKRL